MAHQLTASAERCHLRDHSFFLHLGFLHLFLACSSALDFVVAGPPDDLHHNAMEHAAATTTTAGNTTAPIYHQVADDGVCGFTPASVGLMLASALLFTVVYNASSFVFFRLSATYRHLPAKLQLRWDNRVASTLHALIIVPGCLHAFFFAYDTQNLTPHTAILGCNSGSPPPPNKFEADSECRLDGDEILQVLFN
jgi:hypothetical protein